jgi:hypothetical protein
LDLIKNLLQSQEEMAIEAHQSDKMKSINDVDTIIKLLDRNQFSVTVTEKDIVSVLPEQTRLWAKRIKPQLFVIKAVKL